MSLIALGVGALGMMAKGALTAAIGPFVDEARDAALNAAQDTVRSTIAGRMSIDEWARAAIQGVDKVKAQVAEEGNLQFVGGKLKFAPSANNMDAVTISFQLYYLDEMKKWQLAAAESDVPTAKFTYEALDELCSKGEVAFEVE